VLKDHYDENDDNDDNKKRIQKQTVFKERRKYEIFNQSSLLHIRMLHVEVEDNIHSSFRNDCREIFYNIIQGNNKPTAILVYFLCIS